MKILYDHQIFNMQRYGGISRYFYELMIGINKVSSHGAYLPSIYSNNQYIVNSSCYEKEPLLNKLNFPYKRQLVKKISKGNAAITERLMMNSDYDIFHPTYYDNYFLDRISNKPFVLTVYDMIHEIFPEYYPVNDKTRQQKKQLINKASRIIAISNNTKNDIVKYCDVDESLIDVIYLGSSLERNDNIKNNAASSTPDRYILFTGNRNNYKNFKRFIEAVTPLLLKDNGLHVVAAGAYKFTKQEIAFFQSQHIERQVHHVPFKTNQSLSQLYSKALAFVFPSLYEGFGIPILESFTCGCPTILSNTSSLSEVALDAAYYFDPLSKESIRNSVEKVIYDEKLREELIDKGNSRMHSFSWEKMARETIETYQKVL